LARCRPARIGIPQRYPCTHFNQAIRWYPETIRWGPEFTCSPIEATHVLKALLRLSCIDLKSSPKLSICDNYGPAMPPEGHDYIHEYYDIQSLYSWHSCLKLSSQLNTNVGSKAWVVETTATDQLENILNHDRSLTCTPPRILLLAHAVMRGLNASVINHFYCKCYAMQIASCTRSSMLLLDVLQVRDALNGMYQCLPNERSSVQFAQELITVVTYLPDDLSMTILSAVAQPPGVVEVKPCCSGDKHPIRFIIQDIYAIVDPRRVMCRGD
jgi:hypothetical protein